MDKGKDYFDKGLKNVIDSFEKAKEWADLSNCLQKAKQQIEKYKGLPIPRQRDLAKRLAQCLNPEINVIHQLTLEVYKEVFEREIWLMNKEQNPENPYDRKSSVALFFSGLFNFYQFAAFEVKQTFLDLISMYLLKMKKELILSLPGFMLCMLPALEDQNGEILKKVEKILIQTEAIVGTSEFYGEIWKAMLRTPRARLSAIRYLDKRIPKNLKQAKDLRDKNLIHATEYTIKIINHEVILEKDDAKKERILKMADKMELQDYFFLFYPNKTKLVINALISGLSIVDNSNYVNRATLDFLISHMPINSNVNSIQENIRLVECASLAYTKKDFATLNKLQNWLFEHFDEDEEEIDSQDPTIISIVESQKNLFRKSMDPKNDNLKMKQGLEQGQQQSHTSLEKLINNPILILLRIISDEQSTTVPILKNLSIHLIKYIRYHLGSRMDRQKKFLDNLINLLEQIAPFYKAVLESLATKLQQEIESLDYASSASETKQLESIDIISFAIFDLQQLYKKLLSSNESKLYLTQIFSNLLKGMNKISNENQNLELIIPSLDVVDQILNICEKLDDGATLMKQKRTPNFTQAIESFNQLYVKMCHKLINETQSPLEDRAHYKQELDTFKKYNNIMLKIVPFQIVDSQATQMPEWLDMMIQCSKTNITHICLVSVDVFIKILSLDDRSQSQGESSIIHIQRLIADAIGQSGRFTEKVCKNPPLFKQEFLRLLQQSDQQKQDGEMNGNAHCKQIIQNLWSLLDQEIDTENIVIHLQKFDQLVPRIFSDVVIEDLQNKETRIKQERAIKKFTVFWKFTAPHYPGYKPFETEVSGKKYLALHNMINFLEDPDPTLRLSCRSWLSQSKQYNRILDPIIEEFIKNSNFKFNQDKDEAVLIEGDFETQYVIQNFGKLRNIILNTQDEIIEYMVPRNCQTHILQLYYQKLYSKQPMPQNVGQQIDDKRVRFEPDQFPMQRSNTVTMKNMGEMQQHMMAPVPQYEVKLYLDMLVEITLQFIRAEYQVDSQSQYRNQQLNENQLAETLTVNASACEFMELILKQVEKYGSISNKIAHLIIGPLINTFHHVILKRNYAMQVNIINLIDLILNECNFQGSKGDKDQVEDSKTKCAAILRNQKLIEAIILGLKCDVSFVRQKFIKFVEMLVPYMRKFTKENDSFKDDFKICIEKLVDVFVELLRKVDVSFFSQSREVTSSLQTKVGEQQQYQGGIKQSFGGRDRGTILLKKSSLDVPSKQATDGDLDSTFENLVINQEGDIVLIIGGLQNIISTCLDIKQDQHQGFEEETANEEVNEEEQIRIGKISKNETKKTGFLGGIFGAGETSYFAPDIFSEVRKCITEKLPAVFVSCIYCWNHMSLFNWNDYHFTRHGMFAYNSEDTARILQKMRLKRSRESESYVTFEENLQHNANSIQKKVIQLLRPIAKKIPDQFIEGAITIWLQKKQLGANIDQRAVNVSYEKLIQMLVCVYKATENEKSNRIDFIMPVYQVINSMIRFIQEFSSKKADKHANLPPLPALVNINRWTKDQTELSKFQTCSETLLNSFLYTYLVYNPSMFDPLFEKRSEDKIKEFGKIYTVMIKYFNVFKLSRSPFTVCWLLEILNVVTQKFKIEDAKLDNRLKKDYHDLFNNMLSNCSSIIAGTFNIQFSSQQQYNLTFPPTTYELLWRYEYINFKNSISDAENLKPISGESPEKVMSFSQVVNEENSAGSKKRKKKSQQNYASIPSMENTDYLNSNVPVYFDKTKLRQMIDQKFEYMHFGGGQNAEASIFKNMEILMKDTQSLSKEYKGQSDFMERIKAALRGYCYPNEMLMQSKFFTIITLKQILCQLLNSLVGGADTEKINKSMQIIFSTIIQILQTDMKNAKDPKLDHVMNEFITEFFASTVERIHQVDPELIKPYRREIIDIFNNDTFFCVSMLNLKQWQKIMKYFIDGKPEEIFEEQILKWNFQGGLFENSTSVVQKKCYAMKRIAFLIFSCEDDDFQNQLDQLMKKMIEVFKQKQKNDIKQRLFLFFLTRVMLIRLNFQTLTEALRKLWPHLLNELISVFEVKNETMDKENTDLTIEAIKLVELLSSLNIEDFQMNQWIFLIDGYGMQLEDQKLDGSDSSDISVRLKERRNQDLRNQLNARQTMQSINTASMAQQQENLEVFKTFIVRFIGNQEYSFYNVEKPQDGMRSGHHDYDYQDIMDVAYAQSSNQLEYSDNNFDSAISDTASATQVQTAQITHEDAQGEIDQKLQEQACNLQQKINDSNVIGNEFNRQEAEAKIEIDFLVNDEILQNKGEIKILQ